MTPEQRREYEQRIETLMAYRAGPLPINDCKRFALRAMIRTAHENLTSSLDLGSQDDESQRAHKHMLLTMLIAELVTI